MEEVIHKANHIKHRQCKIYHCTCIALHKHHPSKQLNILLKKMTKVCIKLKKKIRTGKYIICSIKKTSQLNHYKASDDSYNLIFHIVHLSVSI